VPFIERLSAEGCRSTCRVAARADDELRSSMIPVNRKYPIAAIVAAAGSRRANRPAHQL